MKNLDYIKVFKKKYNLEELRERFPFKAKELLKSNKIVIAIFSITFLYLCYLSIPALYNHNIIQQKLENEIQSIFNSNSVELEKLTYTFFPAPHFNIKNIIIYQKNEKNLKIAEIKNINFYISQNNFFRKNDFDIKEIKIINSNIYIRNEDNLQNLLLKGIKNKIKILRSKIFLQDKNNITISIVNVKNFKLNFDEKKNHNSLVLNGKVFNLPFKMVYYNNFYKNESNLNINFKKIKLNFESISKNSDFYSSKNEIRFLNSKFITEINNKKNNNTYEITSNNSKINQTDIVYKGAINIKPFYFDFYFQAKNVNLFNVIFFNKLFENAIKNFFLNNSNLNGIIKVNLSEIKKNNYFEDGKILLNIKRGNFDLSGSEFLIKDIGKIKIISNQIFLDEDKVNLQLNSKFVIENQEKLYKKFLIPRKNRFNLKNIYFLMDIYPPSREVIFSNFEINEKDNKFFQNTNFTINSWQDLRSMFNKLLINYDG